MSNYGKFNSHLDEIIYTHFAGYEEDFITSESIGFYGLYKMEDEDASLRGLSDEERATLATHEACIMHESTDGFVSVTFYEDMLEARRVWETLLELYVPENEDYYDEEREDHE